MIAHLLDMSHLQVPKATPQQQQQKPAPRAGFELGFTRDNEVFVGRLAMTGFAASVVGEVGVLVCHEQAAWSVHYLESCSLNH